MATRPVPRNIDKPNRNAEYAFTFLGTYYTLMFLFHEPLMAFGMACVAVYMIYKFTLDKPEGMAFRFIYRHIQIGKMMPSPKKVKKFEV